MYDGLERLSEVEQGIASNTTGFITTEKFSQSWSLDQLGNWKRFKQDDDGNGTWELEQDRYHNAVNEIDTNDVDSDGE